MVGKEVHMEPSPALKPHQKSAGILLFRAALTWPWKVTPATVSIWQY